MMMLRENRKYHLVIESLRAFLVLNSFLHRLILFLLEIGDSSSAIHKTNTYIS